MNGFCFQTCKTIVNQPGAVATLADYCKKLGATRPLIVTDQGIVSAGLVDTALTAISSDTPVYDKVVADPPTQIINDAVSFAQEHKADAIIGLGGGSTMDTAKLVALLTQSKEKLTDIYGIDQTKGPRLPLILIPTTSGTGSEVTPIAIVNKEDDTKVGIVSDYLIPDVALLDAELTVGLPKFATACTAIDAMVHAIEAFTGALRKNPYSDILAKQALRLLSKNINAVIRNPEDIEARQQMLFGATLAGQAFANSPVGAVHALAYPLGGQFHISHGLSNSLVLPGVLKFNSTKISYMYIDLAECVFAGNPIYAQRSNALQSFIDYFTELAISCELPTRLSEVDIPEFTLSSLAEDAMQQERLLINNPVAVTYDDALEIYQDVY